MTEMLHFTDEQIEEAFNEKDVNDDGFINVRELHELMEEFDQHKHGDYKKLEKKTTTKGIAPAPVSRVLREEAKIAPEEEVAPEFGILGKSLLESKEKETPRPRHKQYRDASHLGPIFIKWCRQVMAEEGRARPVTHFLPPIDISIKVKRIDAVDTTKNFFAATLIVMLDWEDPSLALLPAGEPFDVANHFDPLYRLNNSFEEGKIIGDYREETSKPRRHFGSGWRVKWTLPFTTSFRTVINPAHFPYDFQELKIGVTVRSIPRNELVNNVFYDDPQLEREFLKSKIWPEIQHAVRWRRHTGLMIAENADFLAEHTIVGISGYRNGTKEKYGDYTVTIGIMRQPKAVLYNIMWPMNVVSILVGVTTVMTDSVATQNSAIVTGVLIAVAFKLVLQKMLPRSGTLSYIEMFVLTCTLQMLLLGLTTFVVGVFLGSREDCHDVNIVDWSNLMNASFDEEFSCDLLSDVINVTIFVVNTLIILVMDILMLCVAPVRQSDIHAYIQDTWNVHLSSPQDFLYGVWCCTRATGIAAMYCDETYTLKDVRKLLKKKARDPSNNIVYVPRKSKRHKATARPSSFAKPQHPRKRRKRVELGPPDIYSSPKMHCEFIAFGSDPERPHQRLTAKGGVKLGSWIEPNADRCFGYGYDGSKMPWRNADPCPNCENNRPCILPRTWSIGQKITFEAPLSRKKQKILAKLGLQAPEKNDDVQHVWWKNGPR